MYYKFVFSHRTGVAPVSKIQTASVSETTVTLTRLENTFGIRPTEPVPGITLSRIQRELREAAGTDTFSALTQCLEAG